MLEACPGYGALDAQSGGPGFSTAVPPHLVISGSPRHIDEFFLLKGRDKNTQTRCVFSPEHKVSPLTLVKPGGFSPSEQAQEEAAFRPSGRTRQLTRSAAGYSVIQFARTPGFQGGQANLCLASFSPELPAAERYVSGQVDAASGLSLAHPGSSSPSTMLAVDQVRASSPKRLGVSAGSPRMWT